MARRYTYTTPRLGIDFLPDPEDSPNEMKFVSVEGDVKGTLPIMFVKAMRKDGTAALVYICPKCQIPVLCATSTVQHRPGMIHRVGWVPAKDLHQQLRTDLDAANPITRTHNKNGEMWYLWCSSCAGPFDDRIGVGITIHDWHGDPTKIPT